MNDFLLVLFYQAIVAVNAAVILSAIVWLAKRKEEKDGRKPNPDFTPPQTKRKHDYFMQAETDGVVRRWANRGAAFPKEITVCGKQYMLWSFNAGPDADVAEYREIKPPTTGTNVIEPKPPILYGRTNGKMLYAEMLKRAQQEIEKHETRRGGYQPKPSGTPKPPTTGTNAITPKEHKRDKYSCLYSPFCNLTREQVLDGLDRYIKDFHQNDLLDRVENEMKRIKDDQRTGTQPIQSFIGEVRGGLGNEVMGTVTAKSAEELEEKLKALADRLDRAKKKPVTLERMKEDGFETVKVRVFDPAEKRWTYREVVKNSKCSDCKHWKKETCSSVGKCEVLDRPTKWYERGCQLFEKWEPPIQTTNICQNCKHYLATEEGAETGLCGMKDEITFGNNYSDCFEKREGE